jgi:hypothetical protein
MFPESFAEKWIMKLTNPGETVFDPFSGRGTTALTALLAGRNIVACDVNEVAFCLTSAKAHPPALSTLKARLKELERGFISEDDAAIGISDLGDFFTECFNSKTLTQLLYVRGALKWRTNRCDNMIAALILGSLHGDAGPNSPYFSNQMPRTISMNPAYSVRFWRERKLPPPEKDIFPILLNRAVYRYKSERAEGEAQIFNTDMRLLPSRRKVWPTIRCAITSPPYLNVTSFEEDQWLRLWFLGAPSRPSKGRVSKDDRHLCKDSYWEFIGDMWKSIGEMVDDEGHVVIRLGSRSMDSHKMKQGLISSAKDAGRNIRLVSSRVTEIRRRQTGSFLPDSNGCKVEIDCHFQYI